MQLFHGRVAYLVTVPVSLRARVQSDRDGYAGDDVRLYRREQQRERQHRTRPAQPLQGPRSGARPGRGASDGGQGRRVPAQVTSRSLPRGARSQRSSRNHRHVLRPR